LHQLLTHPKKGKRDSSRTVVGGYWGSHVHVWKESSSKRREDQRRGGGDASKKESYAVKRPGRRSDKKKMRGKKKSRGTEFLRAKKKPKKNGLCQAKTGLQQREGRKKWVGYRGGNRRAGKKKTSKKNAPKEKGQGTP